MLTKYKESENSPSQAIAEKEAPKTTVYNIKDIIKAGSAQFTVNSTREYEGTGFLKPEEGNIYYVVDITIDNISSESIAISSLLMFKLIDSDSYSYDVTVVPDLKGSLDGEIAPGRKLRGDIAFEIPKETNGLELEIDPSIYGTGKVIVKLDK